MIVLKGPPLGWRLPSRISGVAVSVGVFDGVHRGHQSLLARLATRADRSGLTPAVATFDPHPLRVLTPHRAPRMLTSVSHRIEIMEEMGIAVVGVMPFEDIRNLEAERFVVEVLLERLKAELVLVGENFQFGKGGQGSADTLRQIGARHGFEVDVENLLGGGDSASHSGEVPIASSRIRHCLTEGKTGEAAVLLGRPFQLRGEVKKGEGRGRQLGIPTANLEIPDDMCIPGNGIYAAWAEVGEKTHRAALNIGVRPTFGEGRLITEAHLLGFSGDLYGQEMRLRFVGDRIRPEVAFGSVEELMTQVDQDLATVSQMLGVPH